MNNTRLSYSQFADQMCVSCPQIVVLKQNSFFETQYITMGCGLGHKSGSSQNEGDSHGATPDRPRPHLEIPPQESSSQRHDISSKQLRHPKGFASGSRSGQHTATTPTSKKSCRKSALLSKPHHGALPAHKPESSFFGRFFYFVVSRVVKVNDKIFQLSAKQSRAKPPMAMHQSPSQASIIRHTATCPPSSAGCSVNDYAHKNGSNLGLSQQVPVIVEDGLLVPMEAPKHNAPYSTARQPSYRQGEEIPLRDAGRFSARELRDIETGSLSMNIKAFEGPPPEKFRFEGEGERVKTYGGTSQIMSSLPIYAAPECRPSASNPVTYRYLELHAISGWSQRGALSIGFSVSDCDESFDSNSNRLAIRGENGSLYYNDILLGDLLMSPFTWGSIGLGLLLVYNEEASTATAPVIDVNIFHTRQGQLIETISLDRNTVGFDGHHDLFVDLQTVDKVEFEVVFERDWCVYKPVDQA